MGKEENVISLALVRVGSLVTQSPLFFSLSRTPTAGGGDRRHGAYIHGEAKATPITSVIGLHYLVNSP